MALPIADFIAERLHEYDPTFDTGGGIATTALMIDPLSIIMQPLRDEVDAIKLDQSIKTILESEDPDAFDQDIVDALASNVFLERKQGSIASGSVRVRFFSPQDFDIGTGLAAFLDSNGVRFINPDPVSITASEMGLNTDGGYYYVDIPIEAEEKGSNGNVLAGGIQTFDNEPANVASVINPNDFSDGTNQETNLELIDRIKIAVTVRALVTGRGIITQLMEAYSSIEEISPIGMGDPEMQRDIVYNTHIGGKVDVWVKTPSFQSKSYDVVSLLADTTRQFPGRTSLVLETAGSSQSIGHAGVDRTNMNPIVTSIDNAVTYTETADYVMNDAGGTIERVGSGSIYHNTGTTGAFSATDGIQANAKTIKSSGSPWTLVRPGMQIKVLSPSSVVGKYTVKTALASAITIYGNFPAGSVGSVEWQVDDVVAVSYEYNPISVDVIKSVRSPSRSNYTIADTPVMRVTSVEYLNPTTLQPTGVFLDPTGGYGQGGFGVGSFGIGTNADYVLRVSIPNKRFSSEEDNFVDFSISQYGRSVRINYETASEIETYQTFIDDTQNRVETADLLAKHFIPIYVNSGSSGITYNVKSSNTSAKTESEMQDLIESAIEDTKIGTDLELSDLVKLLYDNGAEKVDMDFELIGEIHNTNGTVEFISNTSDGVLEVPENLPTDGSLTDTDAPLSKKISHFISGSVVLHRVTV